MAQSNFFKIIQVLIILSLVLFAISFAGALIFGFPTAQVLRVVFGTIYVLFMPGFIWSYVFFSRHPERRAEGEESKDPTTNQDYSALMTQNYNVNNGSAFDLIERITLSFALSIAMGPLLIFFLNKVGVKINFLNSFLEILFLIIVGLIAIYIKEKNIK